MMLDRYNSHTKHCSVCQKELGRYEKKRGAVAIFKTALVGAGGASAAALIGALSVDLPAAVARAAAISTVTSTLGFTALSRRETALERKIQSFKFEDYIQPKRINYLILCSTPLLPMFDTPSLSSLAATKLPKA